MAEITDFDDVITNQMIAAKDDLLLQDWRGNTIRRPDGVLADLDLSDFIF